MKPENFLDPKNLQNYPSKDFHRVYFGEILNIKGVKNIRNSLCEVTIKGIYRSNPNY